MWRAPAPAPGESSAVASLVLVVRDKGCQCTREDVQRAWRALGTVLGARRERLVAEAEAFNTQHGRWIYALPEWKATNLLKRMDDLTKAADPPPAAPVEDHVHDDG